MFGETYTLSFVFLKSRTPFFHEVSSPEHPSYTDLSHFKDDLMNLSCVIN